MILIMNTRFKKYTLDMYKIKQDKDKISMIMNEIFYNTELHEKVQKEIQKFNNVSSLLEIINPIDEIVLDLINESYQVLRRIAFKTKYYISEKSFKLIWEDFYQRNNNLESCGDLLARLLYSTNLESYMLSIMYDSIKNSKEPKCVLLTDLVTKHSKFNIAKLIIDSMD